MERCVAFGFLYCVNEDILVFVIRMLHVVKVRSFSTPCINSTSTIRLKPVSGYCLYFRLVRLLTRC